MKQLLILINNFCNRFFSLNKFGHRKNFGLVLNFLKHIRWDFIEMFRKI